MNPMPSRFLGVALLATATGCTRVVDLTVDEGPVRLVVEGRIELIKGDTLGLQRIRLTTTDAFANPTAVPAATGATVVVTDDQGRVYPFAESSTRPGDYLARGLIARIGGRYTLAIRYDGDRYEGTDQVRSVSPIDSLYFVFKPKTIASGDSGFRARIDYADPPGKGNYYLWELFVGDTARLSRDPGNRFRVISEDRFYDGGRVIGYEPFDEEVLESDDRVLMRQVALSEASFRFYAALFEQSAGGGSPFSTPPASVRGNVANMDRPARYPLGYFVAAEVAERRGIVPGR